MFLSFICTDEISSFRSIWDCTGMWSFRYQVQSTPKKHNLRQEKLNSIVTLYSDQPTDGMAPEGGIHLPGAQNAQSESLWHLTEKGNKSKFHYVSKLQKLSYSKIRQFRNQLVLIDEFFLV